MTPSPGGLALLHRMQEAPARVDRSPDHAADEGTDPAADAETRQLPAGQGAGPECFPRAYRSDLAAITTERQPEIDALSCKLARQDAATEAHCVRDGLPSDRLDAGVPCIGPALLCHRASVGIATMDNNTRARSNDRSALTRATPASRARVATFILAW